MRGFVSIRPGFLGPAFQGELEQKRIRFRSEESITSTVEHSSHSYTRERKQLCALAPRPVATLYVVLFSDDDVKVMF